MATVFHELSQKVFNAEQPFTLAYKAGANTLIIQAAVTDIRLSAPIEKVVKVTAHWEVPTRKRQGQCCSLP
ncbi:hypothetical protein TUM4644_36820 [Shewanella colwelliana]|nr:hypothetical protein TUM4644_36820 [Shewanella colwelliana]